MDAGPTSRTTVVLLIESDTLTRINTSDILIDAGFRVIAEASSAHAEVILSVRPDIRAVVTDVSVPNLFDGCGFAEKAQTRWPSLGLVVTSANKCEGHCKLPENAQSLAKPYSAAALLQATEAALAATLLEAALPSPLQEA